MTKNIFDNIYRVVVLEQNNFTLNMVYAEINISGNSEVIGVFEAMSGAVGFFHEADDFTFEVSSDYDEFNTKLDYEDLCTICDKLESLRADFEEYDEDDNIIGLSKNGLEFVKKYSIDNNTHNYDLRIILSDDASDDYIYKIQDEWDLGFSIE